MYQEVALKSTEETLIIWSTDWVCYTAENSLLFSHLEARGKDIIKREINFIATTEWDALQFASENLLSPY